LFPLLHEQFHIRSYEVLGAQVQQCVDDERFEEAKVVVPFV